MARLNDTTVATSALQRVTALLAPRDHKAVARMFLWFGLAFLWMGGVMAMNLRWHLAYPGRITPFIPFLYFQTGGVIAPMDYTIIFSLHGTAMIFFATSPILIGYLGNLLIPLTLGARGMAFPRLNVLSFWLLFFGGMLLLTAMYMPFGGPGAGWTSYPPLSSTVGAPGPAQSYWCAAIVCAGSSVLLTAINFITTIVRDRAPGMHYFRMPLTIWGLFFASILNVLFAPVLLVGTLLLWRDRVAGTHVFIPTAAGGIGGGDPVLYQHLFWIFGHPEVYILALPVWGVLSDLLAVFSRKPVFGYRITVSAMAAVTALSALVYGHHMFVVGLRPALSQAFMTLTLSISAPSAVLVLNWLGTLWQGSLRFSPPMVYAIAAIVMFCIGGLTGIYLGTISTDVYLHDTFFVVAHFHFVMAATLLFGIFAALHFWFPKSFGRMMSPRAAYWHAGLTAVFMVTTFGGMLVVGLGGMLRRTFDPGVYHYVRPLLPMNRGISHAAFGLFAAQFIFIVDFVRALVRGDRAEANPWNAATLEWTLPSPPSPHNFDATPEVVRGPHAYGLRTGDRDWRMQNEPEPTAGTG